MIIEREVIRENWYEKRRPSFENLLWCTEAGQISNFSLAEDIGFCLEFQQE